MTVMIKLATVVTEPVMAVMKLMTVVTKPNGGDEAGFSFHILKQQ